MAIGSVPISLASIVPHPRHSTPAMATAPSPPPSLRQLREFGLRRNNGVMAIGA